MSAGTPPALRNSMPTVPFPCGFTFTSSGVWRLIASNSIKSSGIPARRQIALRWMRRFVEPPAAISTLMAFVTERFVTMSSGFTPSSTSPTMRRPVSSAIRSFSLETASEEAEYGSASPSASTTVWHVLAVPMMGHAPTEP